jgi:histidinol dehydrogenase
VRAEGDAAVRRFTAQFGGASLADLRVSPAEFARLAPRCRRNRLPRSNAP